MPLGIRAVATEKNTETPMYKLITSLLLLSFMQHSVAGMDYYEVQSHQFRYEVKGEVTIKPDTAVFPVTITVESESYQRALEKAQKLASEFKASAGKLNHEFFTVTSADFFKRHQRGKKLSLSVSFFDSDNDDEASAKLVSLLTIAFKDNQDFNQRAGLIAEALDFVRNFKQRYEKNDKVSAYPEEPFYEVSNVERYREQIVSSVYQKAKAMADIIGKLDNVSPRIKEVYFAQDIDEEIMNFNSASLSIDAKIEYAFE